MLETIFEFWRNIPLVIRLPLDFWVGIIIMRGIVAKDITSWLEDRGFIKKKEQSFIYRALDSVYFMVKKFVPTHDRKTAIWDHYKLGHQSKSVLVCDQDKCVII